MQACKACGDDTDTDDGVCPECYSIAHRAMGPRIVELEAALLKIANADTYTGGGVGTNLGRCIDIARRALAKST
jgi:hypothetical protein